MSLVIALVLAAASQTAANRALSDWMPGLATNYGGPSEGMNPNSPSYGLKEGSCGYGDLSNRGVYPYYRAVGIPSGKGISKLPTGGCGTCLEFKCVNDRTPAFKGRCSGSASVTVTVTDTCPQCATSTDGDGDHFDLNALSFNEMAPMLIGRIDVDYRVVSCTPPTGLKVKVDGSDGVGLWLRLLITTVANKGTVSDVKCQGAGSSSWQSMTNTYGAAWEVDNSPAYPMSLQVTSGSQTVTLKDVLERPSTGTFDSDQQFSSSGSSSFSSSSSGSSSSSSSSASSTSGEGRSSSSSSSSSSRASSSKDTSKSESHSGSSSSSGSSGCGDKAPSSAYTCAQQAKYGKCGESWMAGFCHKSCGTSC
ncbi:expansin-like protein [Trebouxia sp. C0010 RCD-2024]